MFLKYFFSSDEMHLKLEIFTKMSLRFLMVSYFF